MPRKSGPILSIPICFLSVSVAFADPFGVDFVNFNPDRYGCVENADRPGLYECPAQGIPGASEPFLSYGAIWAPETGLCAFTAVLPNYDGLWPEGEEFKAKVRSIRTALMTRYSERGYSSEAFDDIGEWWLASRMDFIANPGDNFESVSLSYTDGGWDDYPSLPNFEAAASLYYRVADSHHCHLEASRLRNRIDTTPDATSEALEGSL